MTATAYSMNRTPRQSTFCRWHEPVGRFFVAFFFVLQLAGFGLGVELISAALIGLGFTVSSYPAQRREEDSYARELGIKVEASRLEKARVHATYPLLLLTQSVLWLVGSAFLGYGAAQIV